MANDRNQLIISAIMFGVLVWGAFLAIGAYQYDPDPRIDLDPRKGFVVFGFTIAFLLFWGVMLTIRSRRRGADEEEKP